MYSRQEYINTESPIEKLLKKLFNKKEKLIIFDIGGCEGEESIKYSKIFPLSKIFIFEPLPYNQELISKNFNEYNVKNVELVPTALSDCIGKSVFFVSSATPEKQEESIDWDFGNKSSSLLEPSEYLKTNYNWLKFNESIQVDTSTISAFMESKRLSEIDFIHMDVQGAELKVLEGATSFLHKIKSVWLEVSDYTLYKNQPLRKDVENFMINHGFYLIKSDLEFGIGDQFYLNKSYFKTFSIFKNQRHFKF